METMLAFMILILPALPLLRLCLAPAFRRAFPQTFVYIALPLGLYIAGVISLLVLFPVSAIPASLLMLAAILIERWRARPSYGASQGLPPGSLAIFPIDVLLDYLALHKRAMQYGPIFKLSGSLQRAGMSLWFKPMLCITGIARTRALLSQHEDALASLEPPFSRDIPRGFLRYMNKSDHQVYRALFQKIFSPEIILATESFARERMQNCFAALCAESVSRWDGVAPLPYLSKMIFEIWLGIFFGVEPNDPDTARLKALYEQMDIFRDNGVVFQNRSQSLERIASIVHSRQAQEMRQSPAHSFLAKAIALNPNALADSTLLLNLICMLENSARDVSTFLQWIVKKLGDHPVWLERVYAEPAQSSALAERIAFETLRLAQSESLSRYAHKDLDLDGYHIPKGWLIRIGIRESHLDPSIFADPFAFNPDRFLDRTYSNTEYAPLGIGRHSCLGYHLTLSIVKLFVTELARGYTLEIAADGAIEFEGTHWRPSSRFRVRLTARAPASSRATAGSISSQ